jgi:hypothetical protein
MKAIVLHGAAPDNGGTMHPAGAKLTVADDDKPGHISAERAHALVKIHSAAAADGKAAPTS